MKPKFLLFLLLLIWTSCKNTSQVKVEEEQSFNTVKWSTREGRHYPYRNSMLNDLINSVKLHGLEEDSLIRLLGLPDRTNDLYLYYTIRQPYLGNLVPLYTKSLVIKLKSDRTVEWRKIHE